MSAGVPFHIGKKKHKKKWTNQCHLHHNQAVEQVRYSLIRPQFKPLCQFSCWNLSENSEGNIKQEPVDNCQVVLTNTVTTFSASFLINQMQCGYCVWSGCVVYMQCCCVCIASEWWRIVYNIKQIRNVFTTIECWHSNITSCSNMRTQLSMVVIECSMCVCFYCCCCDSLQCY